MNLRHERLRKDASRNPGLVSHHDYRQTRLVQSADCLGRKRENMQPAEMIEITHLFANGSVAIEEDGRT